MASTVVYGLKRRNYSYKYKSFGMIIFGETLTRQEFAANLNGVLNAYSLGQ